MSYPDPVNYSVYKNTQITLRTDVIGVQAQKFAQTYTQAYKLIYT